MAATRSFNAMTAAIDSGIVGSYAGFPLPGVIALVKLTAANRPDPPDGGFSSWLAALVDSGAAPSAVFTLSGDRAARRYGVYERPSAATSGEHPFVSDVTGTGKASPARARTSKAGWLLVGLALLVALVSMASIWGQGARLALTYAILSGSDRPGFAALVSRNDCKADARIEALCSGTDAMRDKAVLTCLQEVTTPVANAPPDTRAALPFDGDPRPHARYAAGLSCHEVWQAARVVERTITARQLDRWMPNPVASLVSRVSAPGAESPALFWPLVGLLAGIMAFGGAVGLGGYGRLFGLWINGQNRYSLSTAQVCMWTALVIAPFTAVTLLHAGMGLGGNTAPEVPGLLFALMGVSFGSTMLSKYILAVKSASPQDRSDDGVGRYIASSTGLARNDSPRRAALLDFFTGEEDSNRDQIDASRFQNVVFTLVLGVCYFAAIVALLEHADLSAVLGAYAKPQRLYDHLPDVTGSFLGLLLVSHAAYLTIKAAPKDGAGIEHGAAGANRS